MFCPKCGSANNAEARFCQKCGGRLTRSDGESLSQPEAVTGRLHDLMRLSQPETTAVVLCPNCGNEVKQGSDFCGDCGKPFASQPAAASAQPETGTSNQRRLIIAAAAAIFLAVAAIAGGGTYYFLHKGGSQSSDKMPVAQVSDVETNTTSTAQTTTQSQTTDYITSLDPLISQNTFLEQQIVDSATEINRVAPAGITDSMLSSVMSLEDQLRSVKGQAVKLTPPTKYSQSQSDFLRLVDFNITRADALYRGAAAWRNNDPAYINVFQQGRDAKDAYYQVLPVFENEYKNAKVGT